MTVKNSSRKYLGGGERLLRIAQVLDIVPVSRSQFYEKVKAGLWPQPVRHLGPRTSAWREDEILALASGEWSQEVDDGTSK